MGDPKSCVRVLQTPCLVVFAVANTERFKCPNILAEFGWSCVTGQAISGPDAERCENNCDKDNVNLGGELSYRV